MFRDFNKGGYKPLIDATWAITSGVSPDKVALWIGDQVETILRHYCHPNLVDS